MKKFEKEIVTKRNVTMFAAHDGTEFTSEEECKAYEESALGVLTRRFTINKLDKLLCYHSIDNFFDDGSQRADYYKFSLESEEDKKNFLQMCELYDKRKGYYVSWLTCNSEYLYPVSGLDNIKLHTVYILEINQDCGNLRLYSKEDFIGNFTKAWELAVK